MYSIKPIDRMDDYTLWTILGDETENLAASGLRITGKYSLEFDKADATAETKIAGAYRTVSLNLEAEGIQLHDKIQWAIYLSALTDVANCFVKLGSSASNNVQWTVSDTSLETGWTLCTATIGQPSAINGTGWDPLNITYMQIGVTFDGEDDALEDIKVDSVNIVPCRYTEDNTEITMDGVSVEANLDALEALVTAGNALLGTIDADTGNCATDLAALETLLAVGTGAMASAQAVTLATDDTQFGAIGSAADVDGNIHGQLEFIGTAASEIEGATETIEAAVAADGGTAPTNAMQIGGYASDAVPTALTAGKIGAFWTDLYRRLILAGYDAAQGALTAIDPTAVSGVPSAPAAQTTLTAPGDGIPVNTDGFRCHTWAVTVVLNTCTEVVVRIDGTLNTGYGTLGLKSTAVATAAYAANIVTLTGSGTYIIQTIDGGYKYQKPVFVSEAGDTDSTVTFQYRGSN